MDVHDVVDGNCGPPQAFRPSEARQIHQPGSINGHGQPKGASGFAAGGSEVHQPRSIDEHGQPKGDSGFASGGSDLRGDDPPHHVASAEPCGGHFSMGYTPPDTTRGIYPLGGCGTSSPVSCNQTIASPGAVQDLHVPGGVSVSHGHTQPVLSERTLDMTDASLSYPLPISENHGRNPPNPSNSSNSTCSSCSKAQSRPNCARRRRRKRSYGKARYPRFASYRKRLESFENWQYSHLVHPEDLAAAGLFYLGHEDKVKCFVSGCGLCNWEKADSPDKEHKGWFPECRYARLRHENPDSLLEFEDSHAVRATLDFGYRKGIVEKAFDAVRDEGITNPNASQLLDVIFEMQKVGDAGYSSGEDLYGAGSDESGESDSEERNLSLEREVDITRAHFNRAETARLKDELKRLEKVMKCHSCGSHKANMVNLPCGHLATCEACVYKNNRCGRCNTLIRGVVKVYMV